MVSFFGLKIGGDKKKKSERVIKPVLKSPWRQDQDPKYEEFFGPQQNHPFSITGLDTPPSRPGTAASSRSSRSALRPAFASPYLAADGGASSMIDLPSMRHRPRGSTSSFFRHRPASSVDTSCILTGEDMSARPSSSASNRRQFLGRAGTPTGPLSLVVPPKGAALPKSSLANSETVDGSVVCATSPTTEKPASPTVVSHTGGPKLPSLDSHTAIPTPPDSVTGSLDKSTRGDVSPLEDVYRSHSSTLRSINIVDKDKPLFPPVPNSYEAPRPAPLPSPALSPAATGDEPDASPWSLPKVKTVVAQRDAQTMSSARQKSVSTNIEHPEKSPFADFKFSNDDDENSTIIDNNTRHRGRDVMPLNAEGASATRFSQMNPAHVPAPLQPYKPAQMASQAPLPPPTVKPPTAQPSGWPLRPSDTPNSNNNTVEHHSTSTLHIPPGRANHSRSTSRDDLGQRAPSSREAPRSRSPMSGGPGNPGNPVHNQIHPPRQRSPLARGRQGPQLGPGPGPANAPPNMHSNQDPNHMGPKGFSQQQPPYGPPGPHRSPHRSPMGRPGPRPGPGPVAAPPRFDSAGRRHNGANNPPNSQAAGPHGQGPFTRPPPRGMGPRATPRPAALNSTGPRGAPPLNPPPPVGAQAPPRSPRTPRTDPDLPRPQPIIDISDFSNFSGPELDLSFSLPRSGPSSPQRSPRPRMELGAAADCSGAADWPLPSPALRSPMSMSPVTSSPARSGFAGSPLPSPMDKGVHGDDGPLPMPPAKNPLRAASPGPGRLPRRDLSATHGSTFI